MMRPDSVQCETIVDLYGLSGDDLAAARRLVEDLLPIKLESRESLYQGGHYYFCECEQGVIRLQRNVDLLWQIGDATEERWAEPKFPEYPILLYVEGGPDATLFRNELTRGSSGVVHLKREQK